MEDFDIAMDSPQGSSGSPQTFQSIVRLSTYTPPTITLDGCWTVCQTALGGAIMALLYIAEANPLKGGTIAL